jgi:putative flippase GtrA
MQLSNAEFGSASASLATSGSKDPLRRVAGVLPRLFAMLPRPARFLGVGAVGLLTDLAVFTLVHMSGAHPLLARAVSLAVATVVTWRLNRMLTFDCSGRHPGEEALRYAVVTTVAQGTSYAVFSALVLTVLGWLPQAALLIGAVTAALLSYNGHRLVSFAPGQTLSVIRSRS